MTAMYVANPTQQFVDFIYRLPEAKNVIIQRISPGGQIRVSGRHGDLSKADVDAIFDQHTKYGMIRASDVTKRKGYCGLVVELDKPVNINRLIDQVKGNRDILIERGKEIRTASAVSLNEQIQANIQDRGMNEVLRGLEFSVEEVKSAQARDTGRGEDTDMARELASTAAIGEGVRVSREHMERPKPAARRRVRRT